MPHLVASGGKSGRDEFRAPALLMGEWVQRTINMQFSERLDSMDYVKIMMESTRLGVRAFISSHPRNAVGEWRFPDTGNRVHIKQTSSVGSSDDVDTPTL